MTRPPFPGPKPGDYFLGQLAPGPGRTLASFGQWVTGDASRYSHAGVLLDDQTIIEAMPGGARIVPLAVLRQRPGLLTWSRWDLADEERQEIVDCARSLEGVPYSWWDYGSLGLAHFHIRPEFVQHRLESTGTMICSQLACFSYTFKLAGDVPWVPGGWTSRKGVYYVPSGRWPFANHRWTGDVTPGDLTYVLSGPEDPEPTP